MSLERPKSPKTAPTAATETPLAIDRKHRIDAEWKFIFAADFPLDAWCANIGFHVMLFREFSRALVQPVINR